MIIQGDFGDISLNLLDEIVLSIYEDFNTSMNFLNLSTECKNIHEDIEDLVCRKMENGITTKVKNLEEFKKRLKMWKREGSWNHLMMEIKSMFGNYPKNIRNLSNEDLVLVLIQKNGFSKMERYRTIGEMLDIENSELTRIIVFHALECEEFSFAFDFLKNYEEFSKGEKINGGLCHLCSLNENYSKNEKIELIQMAIANSTKVELIKEYMKSWKVLKSDQIAFEDLLKEDIISKENRLFFITLLSVKSYRVEILEFVKNRLEKYEKKFTLEKLLSYHLLSCLFYSYMIQRNYHGKNETWLRESLIKPMKEFIKGGLNAIKTKNSTSLCLQNHYDKYNRLKNSILLKKKVDCDLKKYFQKEGYRDEILMKLCEEGQGKKWMLKCLELNPMEIRKIHQFYVMDLFRPKNHVHWDSKEATERIKLLNISTKKEGEKLAEILLGVTSGSNGQYEKLKLLFTVLPEMEKSNELLGILESIVLKTQGLVLDLMFFIRGKYSTESVFEKLKNALNVRTIDVIMEKLIPCLEIKINESEYYYALMKNHLKKQKSVEEIKKYSRYLTKEQSKEFCQSELFERLGYVDKIYFMKTSKIENNGKLLATWEMNYFLMRKNLEKLIPFWNLLLQEKTRRGCMRKMIFMISLKSFLNIIRALKKIHKEQHLKIEFNEIAEMMYLLDELVLGDDNALFMKSKMVIQKIVEHYKMNEKMKKKIKDYLENENCQTNNKIELLKIFEKSKITIPSLVGKGSLMKSLKTVKLLKEIYNLTTVVVGSDGEFEMTFELLNSVKLEKKEQLCTFVELMQNWKNLFSQKETHALLDKLIDGVINTLDDFVGFFKKMAPFSSEQEIEIFDKIKKKGKCLQGCLFLSGSVHEKTHVANLLFLEKQMESLIQKTSGETDLADLLNQSISNEISFGLFLKNYQTYKIIHKTIVHGSSEIEIMDIGKTENTNIFIKHLINSKQWKVLYEFIPRSIYALPRELCGTFSHKKILVNKYLRDNNKFFQKNLIKEIYF